MSLVYRIQSKQDRTRGAYHSHTKLDILPDAVKRMRNAHHDYEAGGKHPTPRVDIGRCIVSYEHCGFDSAVKLLQWFRGWIPALLRAGYEIVALRDVTITAVGEYQVLFKWGTE